MITRYECIPCFVRQASESLLISFHDAKKRETVMRELLHEIANSDWTGTPPAMAQTLYRTIHRLGGAYDPYKSIKNEMNSMAESLLPELRQIIEKSLNPQEDIVRLAMVGNLLDSGAKTTVGVNDIPSQLKTIMSRPVHGDPASLFVATNQASSILYLTDNAGEIYFDKLLIEKLPLSKVTVAVRGKPAINDATMEDAVRAGITKIVPVIENGSDAPGTILEDCSEEFKNLFNKADLIISKGQGNYETLSECQKKICFLLTVKCPVISGDIGAPIGNMVIKIR
jgi:uncharacterized protein with ATP-grasp and redox domains